jgi:ABC-type oligopeptide transport system ATPase subunit
MPPKKQHQQNGNGVTNFYEHRDMQKLITKHHNPHFQEHHISVPFRMAIIGSSGSGKTSCLLNILSKMSDTFGHIHVVYKASEPLYEFLSNKIGGKNITFCTKISDLPPITDFPHKEKQQMIVFDDQVNESDKAHTLVKEWFIRGRKVGKGVSLVYISQSFFKIPKIIRSQLGYLILLKLSSLRDLHLIISDFAMGIDKDLLTKIYRDATREFGNFLKIDLDGGDMNKKFSHNFNQFYSVEDESESDED